MQYALLRDEKRSVTYCSRNMTTTPLLLKIFLLAITSRKSTSFVSNERNGFTWEALWKKMNAVDNFVNYKSSCPWDYIKDAGTGLFKPQLLQIRGKWCTTCCIDLNQSNASHLVINPRGQCSEIKANIQCNGARRIVGYTCVYALSLQTNKRNEGQGPLVNNRMTSKSPSPAHQTQYLTRTMNKNFPTTSNRKENEGDFNKEQQDQYTTVLGQHFVPPFLGNVQFKQPPFLENNNGQLRPSFLNGMNAQIGQPPIMPMFALNENVENAHRSVENVVIESTGNFNSNALEIYNSKTDQGDLEETIEQLSDSQNANEPFR